MVHICLSESGRPWFRYWRFAYSVPSHYQNHCCVIVSWALRNKLQRNFDQNTNVFIHENASENIVYEMAAILSMFCSMFWWKVPSVTLPYPSWRVNVWKLIIVSTRPISIWPPSHSTSYDARSAVRLHFSHLPSMIINDCLFARAHLFDLIYLLTHITLASCCCIREHS